MSQPRSEQRKYPRRYKKLCARIFRPSRKKEREMDFHASLYTRDISIGGAYFQSTFFLKRGAQAEIKIELPEIQRTMHVAGEVVHAIHETERAQSGKPSGFAMRFTRFFDEAEIFWRAYLAEGDLYRFVQAFQRDQTGLPRKIDVERLVELIVRWEIYQEKLARQ